MSDVADGTGRRIGAATGGGFAASDGGGRLVLETRGLARSFTQGSETIHVLRGVEEMSVEEVARALDIPEATVRTRYFRASKLMRDALGNAVDRTLHDAFAFDGDRCDRMVVGVLARARAEGLAHS